MTGRGVKVTGLVAAAVGGLALAGLGAFFITTGVDNADKWASALGIFVSVFGLGVSVYSAILTRRSLTQSVTGSTGRGNVDNSISGGDFHSSVVQAGDVSGLTIGSPAAPSATPDAAVPPPAAGSTGDVTNTIRGGTFYGPAVQVRDVTGLTIGLPAAPPRAGDASAPPAQGGAA